MSAILTSASVHDSPVAIPLAQMTDQRVRSLYDLMECVSQCWKSCWKRGVEGLTSLNIKKSMSPERFFQNPPSSRFFSLSSKKWRRGPG